MTGQRRVDPSAAIFIRQRQNQTGNGQWAITGISEAEQRRKQYQAGVDVTSTGSEFQGKAVRGQTQKYQSEGMVNAQKCQPGQEQDFATCVGKCAAYMWVSEWGAGVARQSGLISDWWQLCDWCNGGWECVCCSAANDGICSPWVMCSSSVVRGNQIRDTMEQLQFVIM